MESVSARQLECFLAVADTGSVAAAARALGTSQPPLSRLIRRLEANLDAELLDRTRTPIRLTSVGLALVAPARLVVSQLRRVMEVAQHAKAGHVGRLSIGFSSSAAITLLPSLLTEYRRAHPTVDVTLHEMTTAAQLRAVASGELDVGIVRGPVDDPALTATSLQQEKFVAILPKNHPLANRRSIPLSALASERFALFPRDVAPGFHRTIIDACHRARFNPDIAQEAAEWHTIVGIVGVGLGVTIAPASIGRLGWSTVSVVRLTRCDAVAEFVIVRSRKIVVPLGAQFEEIATRWSRRYRPERVR